MCFFALNLANEAQSTDTLYSVVKKRSSSYHQISIQFEPKAGAEDFFARSSTDLLRTECGTLALEIKLPQRLVYSWPLGLAG